MDQLPALREDLKLFPGPRQAGGWPSWTVHDPVRHKYFQLGWFEFECLARWRPVSPEQLANRISRETTLNASAADVSALGDFFVRNELAAPGSLDTGTLASRQRPRGLFSRLLHGYLFFRIPLVRPDAALGLLEPLSRVFFQRGFWWLIAALGMLGLFLVSRQWDVFLNTFTDFGNWQGALAFAVTLVVVKILHELGHAFAAKRYGLRVGSMGVAFLVLWPVLYTDATDAWRLTDRRQRLVIGAAGMGVELMLAVLATLAWVLMPDGPWRSAAFMVATITWIGTLLINLNPFLRFDGYYLLSDALGIENLHARSFALGRWWLRRRLLGLEDPPPEHFPPAQRRLLILFAYATWLYRVVLFLGIALLVYHLAFKLLGIFLAAVEIIWFLARPFAKEMQIWFTRRKDIGRNPRVIVFGALFMGLVMLLFLPWRSDIHLPAVHGAMLEQTIYAGVDGRVSTLHVRNGDTVRAGDLLMEMRSPALEHELAVALRSAETVREELRRALASPEELNRVTTLQQAMGRELTHIDGIHARIDRLRVTAPLDGRVLDLHPALRTGLWINGNTALMALVAGSNSATRAYVAEDDLSLLSADAEAWFIPEDPQLRRLSVRWQETTPTAPRHLEQTSLASIHGGPLAVKDTEGRLVLQETAYPVRFSAETASQTPPRKTRGIVRIEGEAFSIANRLSRLLRRTWIRESGF